MSAMTPQITGVSIVCSTVWSHTDQRKLQSSASLPFEWVIHRWSVNSPHKRPVTRKMFPFDDVIIKDIGYRELSWCRLYRHWWYRRLSLWQPPVPPVSVKLASWRLQIFSRLDVSIPPWYTALSISRGHFSRRMMTSPNGNIFRVTGPFWWESTVHW